MDAMISRIDRLEICLLEFVERVCAGNASEAEVEALPRVAEVLAKLLLPNLSR